MKRKVKGLEVTYTTFRKFFYYKNDNIVKQCVLHIII